MKKIYYESPTVEVVDVRVEAGFAPSSELFATDGGISDYTDGESVGMVPYDGNF